MINAFRERSFEQSQSNNDLIFISVVIIFVAGAILAYFLLRSFQKGQYIRFMKPDKNVDYEEQKIELSHRHMRLKEERDQLLYSINDSSNQLSEVKRLIKYFKQGKFIDAFDEESFQDIVKKIIVYSPNEIGFHLKCGITFRERVER